MKQLQWTTFLFGFALNIAALPVGSSSDPAGNVNGLRQRISINAGWRFYKYDSNPDSLIYDVRPQITDRAENKVADAKPTEAVAAKSKQEVLKAWILPSGNDFIKDPARQHKRPEGNPGGDFPFVQNNFDDSLWEQVDLPHDWAIKGPFQTGANSEVGGGMGRLPVNGVAWYRKSLEISASDSGKSIFLDIDGAMSYAMVWINGKLAGGWPYGYNSFRLNLTPYVKFGSRNQLAIRLDNPNHSARWYPGGGIYRNIWLVKTNPAHVSQWGTYITTPQISKTFAEINIKTTISNDSQLDAAVEVSTEIYALDNQGIRSSNVVVRFKKESLKISARDKAAVESSVKLKNPRLWGPTPTQKPNLYLAVTTLRQNGKPIDQVETRFGIRSVKYDSNRGLLINGERIQIKGVNQHHDLGALGAAFNTRATERQLQLLREMGCNAIRTSHNPPAPELLELTDRLGFLVVDEIFDSWEQKKTPHDFHLIFSEWSEPDIRAFIRRDRNHPSVVIWSFGNEVGEQYTAQAGAAVAKRLSDLIKEEDSTRPNALAMNYAKPYMELPKESDLIGLNYQGEGIRQEPEFEGTDRIRTSPQYGAFHARFPDKMIFSSETASTLSSRGIYLFPVTPAVSSLIRDGRGGNSEIGQVSSFELYAVDFGSSPDKVFGSIERQPFVAGEFVWTGWDYLGEPTPYYQARSSYSGIIDLAGFKKDRFYLYQSHWRPDLPMVHILPHWNWPERVGIATPVHLFTSGDEAELFLNGKSYGKKKKGKYEYRLRWDDIAYEPGQLKAVAYKKGKVWAESIVRTTGEATKLRASVDRNVIHADGKDLAFITARVSDMQGLTVPHAGNPITFSIEGPGDIVATNNGNPMDMTAFPSRSREAFNGMALAIVRSKADLPGHITVKMQSAGLSPAQVEIHSK